MSQISTQPQILIRFDKPPDKDLIGPPSFKPSPDIKISFTSSEVGTTQQSPPLIQPQISIKWEGDSKTVSGPASETKQKQVIKVRRTLPKRKPLKMVPKITVPEVLEPVLGSNNLGEAIATIVYPVTNGVMLAEEYRKNGLARINPRGWWASEKWDGVRALWDGRSLWTRAGHMINAPEWFLGRLPPGISLDGELYIKHNWFNKTSGIIRNKVPNQTDWIPIRYMVFDIPHLGRQHPFEQRMGMLKEVVHRWGEPMVFVNQIQIQDTDHLELIHKTLVSQGGEGTMLREPGSMYHGNTRSPKLLKVKDQFEEDCLVCGWEEGKNRNSGRLGALQVKWADPKGIWRKFGQRWDVEIPFYGQFKVGSGLSDADRCLFSKANSFYPIDTKIKLAFTQLQKSGKPKHPAFKGVRVT